MSAQKTDFKAKVQKFGSHLSGMVMPNIGAFIAWGLITALFIPTGWLPNETMYQLVGPMIVYLLPLLIGFTGGRMVHGFRGGVVGATATMGVIVGADMPMFLGAMLMGPVGGWCIKQFDKAFEGKIKSGFEMLINNFSAGIIGAILAAFALLVIGPVTEALMTILANGVDAMMNANLIPFANVFIEPAKVLFLNNALNHGVLGPIGVEQVAEAGQSLMFLLETNPGPGLGILLSFMFFGKGASKASSPGAIIIHFLGGIHEIYFPYILMKPSLLLAVIGGGVAGSFTFNILGAGLVAAPSPGSIFALVAMAPRGGLFPVLAGVLVATVVSFLIAAVILKASKDDDMDLEEATAKTQAMKGSDSAVLADLTATDVSTIYFACDAGMGSSAMGASLLRKKVQEAGLDIEVKNLAIRELPEDAKIVITHQDLTETAKPKAPHAQHISVENFLSSPKYDELIEQLK
ncbi:MAG: PTS mannitol transporter subunit IICBA [Turicibacter sp.]|nr:PTS mannitol transporter subunit IICBA [Turicibacter sp.]